MFDGFRRCGCRVTAPGWHIHAGLFQSQDYHKSHSLARIEEKSVLEDHRFTTSLWSPNWDLTFYSTGKFPTFRSWRALGTSYVGPWRSRGARPIRYIADWTLGNQLWKSRFRSLAAFRLLQLDGAQQFFEICWPCEFNPDCHHRHCIPYLRLAMKSFGMCVKGYLTCSLTFPIVWHHVASVQCDYCRRDHLIPC